MSAAVLVGSARIDLAPLDPLAIGGEAAVYGVGSRAIKIWHAPTPARVRKLEALLARRSSLPAVVVAPEERVVDAIRGEVIGFAMPLLPAPFEPIAVLGGVAQRAARGVSLREAVRALARLLEAMGELHRAGVVVGDLSDQNVAVDPTCADPIRLLDVDSFQIDGLPCDVATEAFLDPGLYGPDSANPCVTADGRPRVFTPESDGYAFAVLLFRVLCGAHPYGGALDALPTLPRRAAARASVLRSDVKAPPRVRDAIEILGASLRARFAAIFERGDRSPFAVDELEQHAASLVVCGCGLEVPACVLPCPSCAKRTSAVVSAPRPGALRVSVVVEAAGTIVAVASADDAVLAVAIEQGLPFLYVARAGRTDRFALAGDASRAGWDVALGSALVAVAPRGAEVVTPVAISSIRGATRSGIVTQTTVTERTRGTAALAVAGDACFRIARGTVLSCRATTRGLAERPVATVMSGATRLSGAMLAGGPAAIALSTSLGAPRWELVGERGSVTVDAPVLAPGEVVRELAAYGDGDAILVLARTSLAGRRLVRSVGFDLRGKRTHDRTLPEDGRAADDVVSGGAFRAGTVVLATSACLVREGADGAVLGFAETSPFTAASAPVALARGGVLVADGRVVRRLELS